MSSLLGFFFDVRRPTITRAFLAAIFAPPLAMVFYGLLMPVWLGKAGSFSTGPITLDRLCGMAVMTCLYGSLFAYAGMVLVGLPTYLALRSVRAEMGIAYVVVGAASLPIFVILRSGEFPPHSAALLLGVAPGFLVAGCWWLLASR